MVVIYQCDDLKVEQISIFEAKLRHKSLLMGCSRWEEVKSVVTGLSIYSWL